MALQSSGSISISQIKAEVSNSSSSLRTLSAAAGKSAPDEFLVLKNAPLSLPPEFYLTPGGPDADLDEVVEPQDIAKRALFGSN